MGRRFAGQDRFANKSFCPVELFRPAGSPAVNGRLPRPRNASPRAASRRQLDLPPFFLQAERNVLRASPCSFLASACLEHSNEIAERSGLACAGADLVAGAIFVVGDAAGAVDCARAGTANRHAAKAVAMM